MSLLDRRFAIQRDLPANLAYFCGLLRSNGVRTGLNEEITALEALQHIELSDPNQFRGALELSLAKSEKERAIFDTLFPAFWQVFDQAGKIAKSKEGSAPSAKKRPGFSKKTSFLTISDWLNKNQDTSTENREAAAYSPFESLSDTDFSEIAEADQARISQLLRALARRIALLKSRRTVRSSKHRSLDLRRTLRANADSPEIMRLRYKAPKMLDAKFVVLADVSRSMEIYSMFLLNFLFAFKNALKKSECFVFSTKLQHIANVGHWQDFDAFRDAVSSTFPEWSGGTRIGECFDEFERNYASRFTDSRTVVIALSDGWDCGDPAPLADAMRRLRSRVSRLLWLNPLMGFEGYAPETGGMQACLPYIDLLHSAHNARSLEAAFLKILR